MRSDRTFLVIRSIMLLITLAIAAVLLATGHVLIGLLFGALAIGRVAMLATMRRRHGDLREHLQARAAARGRGDLGQGPSA